MAQGVPSPRVRLGLKENWRQFAMLVLVNAFVGGMVGIERTVVPLVGSEEFGLVLRTAIFSFIVFFGVVKACSNLVSGVLADKYGRKKVLITGWLIGGPHGPTCRGFSRRANEEPKPPTPTPPDGVRLRHHGLLRRGEFSRTLARSTRTKLFVGLLDPLP